MVLLQIDLTDSTDRKLRVYKAVKGLSSKEEAVLDLIESLDMTKLSEEYFSKDKVKKDGVKSLEKVKL